MQLNISTFIFLKYISNAFEEQYEKLVAQKSEGADPEDKNEYTAEKVFYIPPSSRWKWIQGRATLPTIGKDVDDAMDAIEKDNPKSLRGVLPKVYAQEKLDKATVSKAVRNHFLTEAGQSHELVCQGKRKSLFLR